MFFNKLFSSVNEAELNSVIQNADRKEIETVLRKKEFTLDDFPFLLSLAAEEYLETLASLSRQITRLRYGNTVSLYTPLYISNECVNACCYCGFNVQNKIPRHTLSMDEIEAEADTIYKMGFRHLLLVSGESEKHAPVSLIASVAEKLSRKFAALSIEVYPMDYTDYVRLIQAGVTGIAVYQETYDRQLYASLHKGPKADYDYRLNTPERAAKAGFRELGIGALMGLKNHRIEMCYLAYHAKYLMKTFWRSRVSVSFPRLRDAEGGFQPEYPVSDRQLAQVIFALRIVLRDVDLVLSTREHREFRDGMTGLGITRMSAGSRTNPGGYSVCEESLKQFEIADDRSPYDISQMILEKGLEPVWKDFDSSFLFE